MERLTARDIMQTDVITIGPDATVRELADLLAEHEISGVPVVDAEGALVGIVTEGDVILQDAELHFPHYVQFLDSVIYLESVRKFEERFRKTFGNKVADVMSTEVFTVAPGSTIHELTTLMADNKVNRLPVVEDGNLVGIITRGDIVRAIAARGAG
jgi:CBS domain-containing protein